MNTDECKELAGWIGLVHPEILDEFQEIKKNDPYFLNVTPSKQYFDTKDEIDKLVEDSKFEFTARNFNPKYKCMIGYYYKDRLAFTYDCTCIEGGHLPHLTYWDDFFKRNNEYKERAGSNPDCHYEASNDKKVIRRVKKILDQIAEYEGSLVSRWVKSE